MINLIYLVHSLLFKYFFGCFLLSRDYSKYFVLLPFLNRRLNFYVTCHVPKEVQLMKFLENFEFCLYKTYKNMFLWARKLKKNERIEENYIWHFKSKFICQFKKKLEDSVSETQFKFEYFCRLADLKSSWNNPFYGRN